MPRPWASFLRSYSASIALLMVVTFICSCNGTHAHNDQFYETVASRTFDMLYKEGKKEEASRYIDSIYAEAPPKNPYYIYRRLDLKSGYGYEIGRTDLNELYIDSCIYVLEHNHLTERYYKEYANALNGKGNHYFDRNELQKAFDYFFRSKMAVLETNDSCLFSNHSYHMGMVAYRQEKYGDAAALFQLAGKELDACHVFDKVILLKYQEFYSNTGLCYTKLKKYDSATLFFNRAIKFLDENADKLHDSTVKPSIAMARGVIYGNLAKIYIAKKSYDTAIQLLQKSIAINTAPGYEFRDAEYGRIQLAELYYQMKNLPDTKNELDRLYPMLVTLPNLGIHTRYDLLLYKYFTAVNNYHAAQASIDQYMLLKDSLDIINKRLNQTDFVQLLKTQDIQYRIKLLTKDNLLKALYLWITIGLAIIAMAILTMAARNYRRTKKNLDKLTDLNTQINEQKNRLEEVASGLTKSNQDMDRILHVVAHDLRNPVSGISAMTQIMYEENQDPMQQEGLEMVMAAAQSSLTLISDLLEFSGGSKMPVHEPKVIADLNEILQHAVTLMRFKASEKDQQIMLMTAGTELRMPVYREKMLRVINNLIANAIKFSPAKSAIYVSVTQGENENTIEVRDEGIGIPDHIKPRIFDSFTSAKRYGTEGESSFGLGLSICSQIVAAHNGRIWLESEEGKGSSFFVSLPDQDADKGI